VRQDDQVLVVGQPGFEEWRAIKFGELILAGPAIEQPIAGLAEVIDDEEIILAPPPVEVALGILAAETG
jgi:hypothetical protein